ncbi:MAG: FHA domain-containing protein [Planctomycetota bacterium]
MSSTGIDLNDSALAVAETGSGSPRLIDCDGGTLSPGFSAKDGQTGSAARAQAQRAPQAVTDQAWERLTDEPAVSLGLGEPLGASWSELARRHLAAVHATAPSGNPTLLAVPATWSQSGPTPGAPRVLAVAHAAGVPVAGTIGQALAATVVGSTHSLTPGAPVLHLDLTRAEGVLTTLQFDGKTLSLPAPPVPVASSGFRALEDAVMLGFDGRMAETTGVLPSENPELAQALYDQLPQFLSTLQSAPSARLEVPNSRLSLTRDEAAVFCRRLVQRLTAAVETACSQTNTRGNLLLKLGAFAAQVPGLREALAELRKVVIEELPAGKAAMGAAHLCAAYGLAPATPDAPPEPITEVPVNCMTGYRDLAPIENAAVAETPEQAARPGRQFHTGPAGFITRDAPTHFLFQGRALPLEGSSFSIGSDPGEGTAGIRVAEDFPGLAPVHAQLTRQGNAWHASPGPDGVPLLLNQQPVAEPAPLQTGDILTLGDSGLKAMLIRTLD